MRSRPSRHHRQIRFRASRLIRRGNRRAGKANSSFECLSLSRRDVPTVSVEESKNRRKTQRQEIPAGASPPAGHETCASAATRFAGQGGLESKRQAALDRELFVSSIPDPLWADRQ